MAKKQFRVAIGIELTEDFIKLAQVRESPNGPIVEATKIIASPPRAIVNGKFLDINSIADYLLKTLGEAEFWATNIVVSYNDPRQLKSIEDMPPVPDSEIVELVHERLHSRYPLVREDYSLGYQRDYYHTQTDMSQKIPVLFGGIAKHRVDAVREIVGLLPNNLVAIDLVPLAAYRLVWVREEFQVGTAMMIYVDPEYLDVALVRNQQFLGVHSIRRAYSDIVADEGSLSDVIQKIKHVMFSVFNTYPDMEPPDRIILLTVKENIRQLQDAISEAFDDFKIDQFEVKQTITFSAEAYNSERLKENYNTYIPAIGLALRFFERGRPSLSLTKIKLQFEPVINRFELFVTGVAAAVLILAFSGWSWQLHMAYRDKHIELSKIRGDMTAMASGQVVLDEQKLKAIQSKIQVYDKYRPSESLVSPILADLILNLPDDLTFDRLEINPKSGIKVNGAAYRSESVLRFNRHLQAGYSNVEVRQMDILNDQNGVPQSRFEIAMDRKPNVRP